MGTTVLCVGETGFASRVEATLAERDSIRVIDSPSLEAARETLESRPIDCVVSAVALPEDGGIDAVATLREAAPGVPIVLAPPNGDERLAAWAIRTDGLRYVVSDVDDRIERLSERLEETLQTETNGTDVRLRSFKRAVEQAGHSIYITDTDGTIRYVNPAFEETTGYSAEQAVGRTPRILKSGKHDTRFYEDLWDTILGGDVWRNDIINRRADGTEYVVNQTIAPIEIDGRIQRFVAVNADITERFEWEERLETLHDATREWLDTDTTDDVSERACQQLADLFDAETVCICCRDEDGELTMTAWCGPDGETPTETCDCSERVFEVQKAHLLTREDGQPASELLLPAGEYGIARLTSSDPDAFDETDLAIGRVFVANLVAVLDSVSTYRKLKRQNERLDEFAGVVSHDLRNPLSVAMGFLDLLEERLGDDDDLQRVRESLDHMDEIIDDVLWLASEGEDVGEREPVSLRRSAERSWSLVDTKDASLDLDIGSDVRIEADPDLFHRLLENFFANAVEHGGEDVTVTVGTLDDEAFYVEDDGAGVPPERHCDIFDVGHTTSEEGTGFGLAIVERIVEGHGWAVTIDESEAGGARFVVQT